MDNQPHGLEEMRAELGRLRDEMRDLRDDLEYHLMGCEGSHQVAPEWLPGVA